MALLTIHPHPTPPTHTLTANTMEVAFTCSDTAVAIVLQPDLSPRSHSCDLLQGDISPLPCPLHGMELG